MRPGDRHTRGEDETHREDRLTHREDGAHREDRLLCGAIG